MEQFDGDAIDLKKYEGDAIQPDKYNGILPSQYDGIQMPHRDGLTDDEFRDKIANLLELEKCFNEKHYISIDAMNIVKKMSKEDLVQLINFYNRAIAKLIDTNHSYSEGEYKEIVDTLSNNIEEHIQIMARDHMSLSENMKRELSLRYSLNSNNTAGTSSVENIIVQTVHDVLDISGLGNVGGTYGTYFQ